MRIVKMYMTSLLQCAAGVSIVLGKHIAYFHQKWYRKYKFYYQNMASNSNAIPSDDSQNLTSENSSVDFALLASCNHTILSYGTFSFWSGFLSNGKRVIPEMVLNQYSKNPLGEGYKKLLPFTFPDEGLARKARISYPYIIHNTWCKDKMLNTNVIFR